jgi:excisionase family DNA binding protein
MMSNISPRSPVKTVDEIADELQVHRITIYRLLKSGKIPGFKIGRVWRFDSEQVRDWLAHAHGAAVVPNDK